MKCTSELGMCITKMIYVADDCETLSIGSTGDELEKYLKECADPEYAEEVLEWFSMASPGEEFRIPNGEIYDTWTIV